MPPVRKISASTVPCSITWRRCSDTASSWVRHWMKPSTIRLETSPSRPARSAIRTVVGKALGGQHVARAANRVQQRPFEAVLELAPQSADVDVNDVGAGVEMIVPHLLEEHGAGDDAAFVAGEIFEQQIFARLQFDLPAAAPDRPRQRVDFEVADRDAMLGRVDPGLAPPQQR